MHSLFASKNDYIKIPPSLFPRESYGRVRDKKADINKEISKAWKKIFPLEINNEVKPEGRRHKSLIHVCRVECLI